MIDEEIAVRLFSKKFGNLKEKSYEKKRFVFDTETGTDSFVSTDKNSNGDALVAVKIFMDEMSVEELTERIMQETDTEATREEKEMRSDK